MRAATCSILALSIIFVPLVSSVPVNKGVGRSVEIAYGATVDSAIAKSSYPFMARIILDGSFKCGGALISNRFVATARHCLEFCPCFDEANPSNDWTKCKKLCILKLRENSDFIPDTETVHVIKTIHLPENSGKPYETRGQRTDLALIELAESANTCTKEETAQGRCWMVTPVRLPDPSIQIKEGQKVRTLGWGATEFSFGDEQSEFLAQLDITINSTTLYHFLIETNVGPNGADPCKGDSGGPLLLRGDDLEWTLVGTLVGGGYACENPEGKDLTSEWNKIGLHVPWITSVMGTTTVDKNNGCTNGHLNCISKDKCPYVQELYSVKDNASRNSELRNKTITKLKSMICDKKKRLFCCPLDENGDEGSVGLENRWGSFDLVFKISKYPTNTSLSKQQVDTEVRKAFSMWEEASGLTFEEVRSGRSDIDISFEQAEYGDGDFFAPGQLGHAFSPQDGGDIHISDNQDWSVTPSVGIWLLPHLTHCVGHSLGLGHSTERSSAMVPFFQEWDIFSLFSLSQGDVESIQKLYGKNI